jgi:hypothetical protein
MFDPEKGVQQRINVNSNGHMPYDLGAIVWSPIICG